MRDETLALLDEFAAAWARGETPDPRELVDRAPAGEREELTRMLDRYLTAAPAREMSEATLEYMRSIASEADAVAEPPLLALRLERRLTREAVVERLIGLLGLDPGKRAKVRRYFSDLEVGVLDPKGVQQSVWDALGQVLGKDGVTRALSGARGVSLSIQSAYYRVADEPLRAAADALPAAPAAAEEDHPDEVDRLFTSGK